MKHKLGIGNYSNGNAFYYRPINYLGMNFTRLHYKYKIDRFCYYFKYQISIIN